MVPERLADAISKVLFIMRIIGKLLARQVSLIAGLKHMKKTIESSCKKKESHYVLASFVFSTLSDLSKVSFIAGKAASYVENEAFVQFMS